ncbi:MAG: 2-C-methyl-D-erythritol 4-phosphate cytidylyltransferase, partial [Cyanobacteria bacterium J06641_2]
EKALSKGWEVTDDAALFEKCDLEVLIVPGEETNLKITTPQDLAIAEFILKNRD